MMDIAMATTMVAMIGASGPVRSGRVGSGWRGGWQKKRSIACDAPLAIDA